MPWFITWQVPLVMRPSLPLSIRWRGKLVGAAEKVSGAEPTRSPFFSARFFRSSPSFDGKHEGLFRIDVLARIERLLRHLVMRGRYGQVDDNVDVASSASRPSTSRRAAPNSWPRARDASMLMSAQARISMPRNSGASGNRPSRCCRSR
jgi:hypothetical protein